MQRQSGWWDDERLIRVGQIIKALHKFFLRNGFELLPIQGEAPAGLENAAKHWFNPYPVSKGKWDVRRSYSSEGITLPGQAGGMPATDHWDFWLRGTWFGQPEGICISTVQR